MPCSRRRRARQSGRGLPQSKTLRVRGAAVIRANASWTMPASKFLPRQLFIRLQILRTGLGNDVGR